MIEEIPASIHDFDLILVADTGFLEKSCRNRQQVGWRGEPQNLGVIALEQSMQDQLQPKSDDCLVTYQLIQSHSRNAYFGNGPEVLCRRIDSHFEHS